MVSKQAQKGPEKLVFATKRGRSFSMKHALEKRRQPLDGECNESEKAASTAQPKRPPSSLPENVLGAGKVLRQKFGEWGIVRKMLDFESDLVYLESVEQVHSLARRATQACLRASASGSERQIRKLVSCVHEIVGRMKQYPESLVLQETAMAYLRKLSFDSMAGSRTNVIYPLHSSGVIPVIILAMQRHGDGIARTGLELLMLLFSSSDLDDMTKCRRAVHEIDRAGGLDVIVSALTSGCGQNNTQLMAACVLKKMVVFYASVNMLERIQSHLVAVLETITCTDGHCDRDGAILDENIL